ncbi:uncharacterized protein LOC129609541 [Condylostylus longicornis]|uniref:uncharacterized protein LOC129609541 n=1 Tax=Condylostylus longicornis TaxID=2530218 RepID=UPI00244DD9D3|nr:uncharacterized protein LOC129609541 [Condylostylus longicornis]
MKNFHYDQNDNQKLNITYVRFIENFTIIYVIIFLILQHLFTIIPTTIKVEVIIITITTIAIIKIESHLFNKFQYLFLSNLKINNNIKLVIIIEISMNFLNKTSLLFSGGGSNDSIKNHSIKINNNDSRIRNSSSSVHVKLNNIKINKNDCSLTKLYKNDTLLSSSSLPTSSSSLPLPSSVSYSHSSEQLPPTKSTSSSYAQEIFASSSSLSTSSSSSSSTFSVAITTVDKDITNKTLTATTIPQYSIKSRNFSCDNFSNEYYTEKDNFNINQTEYSPSIKHLKQIEENKEQLNHQQQQLHNIGQYEYQKTDRIGQYNIEDITISAIEMDKNNNDYNDDSNSNIMHEQGIIIDQEREKELEDDELQQKLQLEKSFHTIILDNTLNEDFNDDDNIDDLSVFDMTSMDNIFSTINTNNYNNNLINNNNNNNNYNNSNILLYDTTTFIPFTNFTSSSQITSSLSSSSSSLSSISSLSTSSLSSASSSSNSLHGTQITTANDLFELTLNTTLSNFNYTISNNYNTHININATVTATATAISTTTTTIEGTINDSNFHYSDHFNWKNLCLLTIFFTFIVITIIGNTLVILAVITTRRLRTVTNCFVMSLAVADLLVGIFVMPPAVAVHILDSWPLSWVLCDIYISLDVLLCTASILSLCAISVDRYLAVTQPLTYSRKRRSKRLALIMILIVWLLALAITCPPILGWYEQGRRDLTYCRYNQNEGYVIFSAMGSFFIPMTVMIYVYARISCVVASRHDNMTDIINNKKGKKVITLDTEAEIDQMSSEQDDKSPAQKKQTAARTLSSQTISRDINDVILTSDSDNPSRHLNTKNGSSYELIPTSRTPSFKRQTSALCSSKHYHQTTTTITSDNRSCASESSEQHQQHLNQQQSQQQQQQQQQHQKHWANYGRHSVRMQFVKNTTLIIGGGESYVTRNTRVHHQKSLSNRITSLNKENKTTQTLSIVVGGFIVCWLPFFLNYIIAPFLTTEQRHPSLDEFLTWLGWFNSAVNPFIYAFYSVDFRAAFWRLTLRRCYKNSGKNQFPSNTMSIRR